MHYPPILLHVAKFYDFYLQLNERINELMDEWILEKCMDELSRLVSERENCIGD